MSISRNELWCTICSRKGHTKDYCKFNDALDHAVHRIHIETFCDICNVVTNHATREFPQNLRNIRPKLCHILRRISIQHKNVSLMEIIEQTFTYCIIQRWPTRTSTEVMEMATEVEAEEVIKDEEEEDEEISPDDIVEAVTTSSTVGKTTTSV